MDSLKDALKDSVDAFKSLAESIRTTAKPLDPAALPPWSGEALSVASIDPDKFRIALADDGVSRRKFMDELMGGDTFSEAPGWEPAPITIMPGGRRIIPVRAVKEVSMMEMAERRKFFSPDQLNEQIVHDLLRPLVEQLDEMGLIDLEVRKDSSDRLIYSITLNVVKDERG
jgi:hypothetical protein